MKANELRIGNYVKFGNNICKVYEINNINYYARNEKTDESLKSSWAEIEPIPLTEEWLLKFGYELTPLRTYLQPNSGNFIWFEKGMKCVIAGEFYVPILKYVHQLQNLYFALTNEELIIKN